MNFAQDPGQSSGVLKSTFSHVGKLLLAFMLGATPALGWTLQPSPREIVQTTAEEARQAMASGDFATAVARYRELTMLLPDLPGPKMNLGIALYMDGRFRQAADLLEPVAGESLELAPAWLFLGASRLRLDEPAKAVPPLRAFLEHEPDHVQGRTMLAEALLGTGRYAEAAEQYRRLTALAPKSPRAWHSLGKCYESLALQAFERLTATAAESAHWFALLGDLRMAQQQYQAAFFLYRKALDKQPVRGLHVAVAQIYRVTGHPEWARQEEQKELSRGLPDCDDEPMVCAFLEGRMLDVAKTAEGRDDPEALYWKSKAFNNLALQAYNRLTQLPPSFELHAVLAKVHGNNGRHQQAAEEWQQALKLQPGDPVARQELALSLYLARNYEAAEPLVEELLQEDPNSAQANFLAGALRLDREQIRDAIPYLERALRRDPDLTAAGKSLGRAYLTLGETEKAIPHLEAALVEDEDGSLHYQLSRAYQAAGRPDDARAMLEKYREIQQTAETEQLRLSEEIKITPP